MTCNHNKLAKEVSEQIDIFVKLNVRCETCRYYSNGLFGPWCDGPESPLGHLDNGDSFCEQHEFSDAKLDKELQKLQMQWLKSYNKEMAI
jgi:hypothetical protein